MADINKETIRKEISARRGYLNDKFIEDKIWEEMDITEYFKRDSLLSILVKKYLILEAIEKSLIK